MIGRLLLVLSLLMATSAYAKDTYVENISQKWKTNTKLRKHVEVKSVAIKLTKEKLIFILFWIIAREVL